MKHSFKLLSNILLVLAVIAALAYVTVWAATTSFPITSANVAPMVGLIIVICAFAFALGSK